MEILICEDIDKLGEDFVVRCMEILPAWRKEQMQKIKHLGGRVQCAVAYLLVRSQESEDGNCRLDNDINPWIYNEYLKPYLDGRDDLFFSISHCKSAAAVVIDDEEVGIDIEEISRYKESLLEYVTNETEIMKLEDESAVNKECKAEKFIELWTKKEAVFKLLGTGITHEIKDILRNNANINVISCKIGEKCLSVATRKVIDNDKIKYKFVNIEELWHINH